MDAPRVKEELDRQQLRRLLAVGRGLVSELDLETVLGQVLEAARSPTSVATTEIETDHLPITVGSRPASLWLVAIVEATRDPGRRLG